VSAPSSAQPVRTCIPDFPDPVVILPSPFGRPVARPFLFSHRPHEGRRAAFDEGYAAHLEWHRANRDSLTWLAWDVIAGPRLGHFVDGIFGVSFAAIDERVDPAGDVRDAAVNVEPHAQPTTREMLRLRRDLSTATVLEDGSPGPLAQVVRYAACASCDAVLDAFAELRADATRAELAPWAVYESVAGDAPGFVLMIWRDRWTAFDHAEADPARVLLGHLARVAPGADIRVSSEIWRYRADLTYTPVERRQDRYRRRARRASRGRRSQPDDRQLAEATGESAHTLRYWDEMGLLPGVRRNSAGHRRFVDQHVGWVGLLERLRTSGMSVARMRRYAQLAAAGDDTKPGRLALLRDHACDIRARLAELERCLDIVEARIDLYEGRRTDVREMREMVARAKHGAGKAPRGGLRSGRPVSAPARNEPSARR
jgi:DNA-binding transcriptional MerR regulator